MSFFNRVKFQSGSNGASAFAIGAALQGFRGPTTAGVTDGTPVSYTAENYDASGLPLQWETGHGTYHAGANTVSRDTPLEGNTALPVSFTTAPVVRFDFLAQDVPTSWAAPVAAPGVNYQTPLTGFTITMGASDFQVILNPAGTLASGTLMFPASPVDDQIIDFSCSQCIQSFTLSPNAGQSIVGYRPTKTMIPPGSGFQAIYRAATTTWYIIGTNLVQIDFDSCGGVGDGATDNSAAWTKATGMLGSTGGLIRFRHGANYFFNSGQSFTYPQQTLSTNGFYDLTLEGGASTQLSWNGGGMTLTMNSTVAGVNNQSVHVRGVSFVTQQAGLSTGLTITQAHRNVGSYAAQSVIENVSFNGGDFSGTHYWSTALTVTGVSNINFNNVIVQGNQGSPTGTGMVYGGLANTDISVVANYNGCTTNGCSVGFQMADYCQGVTHTACNFTTCATGVACVHGLSGVNAQLAFVECQFGVTLHVATIETPVNYLSFVDCLLLGTGSNDLVILGQLTNTTFDGCDFSGGGNAIVFAVFTASAQLVIDSCTFTTTLSSGVAFQNITVNSNTYTATTATNSTISVENCKFDAVTTPIVCSGAFVANSFLSIKDNTCIATAGTNFNISSSFAASSGFSIAGNDFINISNGTTISITSTMNANSGGRIGTNSFTNGSGTAISLGASTNGIGIGDQTWANFSGTKVSNSGTNNFDQYVGSFNGAGGFTHYIGNIHAGAGDRAVVVVCGNTSGTDTTSKYMEFWDPSLTTNPGWINKTNATTISLTNSSDKRLKKNIGPTRRDSLGIIKQIPVEEFEWKDTGVKVEAGFVAQHLNEVYPDAVFNGGDERWGVSAHLDPLVVHSMQQMLKRIEELERCLASQPSPKTP